MINAPRCLRVLLLLAAALSARAAEPVPVTPGASTEARALLRLLYDISGKHTLTGQHNYPNIRDRNTRLAKRYTGRMPAVFSTDWGHAKPGDTDSYLARPDIVQECIRQHREGSLVTICWHAVPPTADEPITFAPQPGSDPAALKSVQGRLQDQQFRDVLTPGTALHRKWENHVDAIAVFLKQLEAAKVPVLWRPYHEMNGDWFWWGGRGADTAALYRQIFDRLVQHHGLKNLVWVWSMDRVSRPGMEHERYFPGIEYVDVLGLDVYGNDFAQSYYQSLERLSQGKPLALAEVGNPPALDIMARQPKWTFYVTWAGMVRNTTRRTYDGLFRQGPYVNRDDPEYPQIMTAYREACGLPPLRVTAEPPDYSGEWVINEELSEFGRQGAASSPAALSVIQDSDGLTIRTTQILEYAEDRVREETLTIDGPPSESDDLGRLRTTAVKRGPGGRLVFNTAMSVSSGSPGGRVTRTDTWELSEDGRRLTVHGETSNGTAPQRTKWVFDRCR